MQYYRLWIYSCNGVLGITSAVFTIFAAFVLADVRLSLLGGVELYHPTFLYAYAALILQCGVVQTIGCLGAQRLSHKLLSVYWILLLLLTVGDVVVGLVWVFKLDKVKLSLRSGLTQQFLAKYSSDATFTRTWDHVQKSEHCCGVDGPLDFDNLSLAHHDLDDRNRSVILRDRLFLPESCCSFIYEDEFVTDSSHEDSTYTYSHEPSEPFFIGNQSSSPSFGEYSRSATNEEQSIFSRSSGMSSIPNLPLPLALSRKNISHVARSKNGLRVRKTRLAELSHSHKTRHTSHRFRHNVTSSSRSTIEPWDRSEDHVVIRKTESVSGDYVHGSGDKFRDDESGEDAEDEEEEDVEDENENVVVPSRSPLFQNGKEKLTKGRQERHEHGAAEKLFVTCQHRHERHSRETAESIRPSDLQSKLEHEGKERIGRERRNVLQSEHFDPEAFGFGLTPISTAYSQSASSTYHDIPDEGSILRGSPNKKFLVFRHGCGMKLLEWLDHVSGILFIMGFCIIGFIKVCFLIILRYEIREMIEKINMIETEDPTSPCREKKPYNNFHQHNTVTHPLLGHAHRASTVSNSGMPTIKSPDDGTGSATIRNFSKRRASYNMGASNSHSQETVNMTLLITTVEQNNETEQRRRKSAMNSRSSSNARSEDDDRRSSVSIRVPSALSMSAQNKPGPSSACYSHQQSHGHPPHIRHLSLGASAADSSGAYSFSSREEELLSVSMENLNEEERREQELRNWVAVAGCSRSFSSGSNKPEDSTYFPLTDPSTANSTQENGITDQQRRNGNNNVDFSSIPVAFLGTAV